MIYWAWPNDILQVNFICPVVLNILSFMDSQGKFKNKKSPGSSEEITSPFVAN